MTVMTSGVRVGGDEAALVALQDQGLFGPTLGESLAGPMLTAGLRPWTSGNGRVRAGLWSCTEERFRTTFRDDDGEVICVVSEHPTCVADSGPITGLAQVTRCFSC
jgi:uncharacterized cupin superfamily protein